MPLTPEIAPEVLAACQQNAQEAADALSRAWDVKLSVSPSAAETLTLEQAPAAWNGPGLVVMLKVDAEAVLVVFPESSGLLPSWYRTPDATGKSKLTTLAQELGMILLPEALMPADFAASHVDDLLEAVRRGGIAASPGNIPLQLTAGEKSGTGWLLWPASQPDQLFVPAEKAVAEKAVPKPEAAKAHPTAGSEASDEAFEAALEKMPPYVRSLLKIRVTVGVTLATTRQPVARILNMGPGSIIQFERHCEQPLLLQVGDRAVAEGEAVKIGDKFGIRITSMVMPGERFFPLLGRAGIRKAS